MTLFGLVTPKNQVVDSFMIDTNRRLQGTLLKSPFNGKIISYPKGLHVVSITPVFFNFTFYGWMGAAGIFMVWGLTNWLIPPVILGMCGFFWTKYFFQLMLKLGLRKAGYKGQIDFVAGNTIIEMVVFNGTK